MTKDKLQSLKQTSLSTSQGTQLIIIHNAYIAIDEFLAETLKKMQKMQRREEKKRAAGRIRQLLLTNPLNSQLDTNVMWGTVGKKWIYPAQQSLL